MVRPFVFWVYRPILIDNLAQMLILLLINLLMTLTALTTYEDRVDPPAVPYEAIFSFFLPLLVNGK